MSKINFLIVGTQKAGTTALTQFLAEHPQICLAKTKEVHYFDNDSLFGASYANHALYHQHFPDMAGYQCIGEATPIYMYWKAAPKRIHTYNPAMKLICILRDPADRAYSHYMMTRIKGTEYLPFSVAIRIEKIRRLRLPPRQHRFYSYIDRGFYAVQIQRLFQYFSWNNMLFLKNEDLRFNHTATINRVCDFLGVYRLNHMVPSLVFSHDYPPMPVADRRFLVRIFVPDIAVLEALLGWDCTEWKT